EHAARDLARAEALDPRAAREVAIGAIEGAVDARGLDAHLDAMADGRLGRRDRRDTALFRVRVRRVIVVVPGAVVVVVVIVIVVVVVIVRGVVVLVGHRKAENDARGMRGQRRLPSSYRGLGAGAPSRSRTCTPGGSGF